MGSVDPLSIAGALAAGATILESNLEFLRQISQRHPVVSGLILRVYIKQENSVAGKKKKTQNPGKHTLMLGKVPYACNPSTQELGRLRDEASLGCIVRFRHTHTIKGKKERTESCLNYFFITVIAHHAQCDL